MKTIFRFLTLAAAALFSCAVSPAQVLMLDFGPTQVAGADQSNSPYHTVTPSFTGTVWNQIQNTDVGSGLSYADGTAATGVSLNIGATTNGDSTTVGLSNTPSVNNPLGGSTNTGIYAGTSVGTDGISTSSSGHKRFVGFQLGGLAAGTYDIYLTSRNTSTNSSYDQIAYVGTSSTSGDFNAISLSLTGSLSYAGGSDAILNWQQNENYLKFTVTLGASQYLNLAVVGGTDNEKRGFLNSVQIVAVPEPSALLLLGLTGACLALRRRRGLSPSV